MGAPFFIANLLEACRFLLIIDTGRRCTWFSNSARGVEASFSWPVGYEVSELEKCYLWEELPLVAVIRSSLACQPNLGVRKVQASCQLTVG